MLIIERPIGSGVYIGHDIYVQIGKVKANRRVKLAIEAPKFLPVVRDELVQEDGPRARQPRATPSSRDLRVIVVEDNPDHAELARLAFRSLGEHTVHLATCLDEAMFEVDQLRESHGGIDLILLDYYLGTTTGCELIPEFRRHELLKNTPIVMLSMEHDRAIVSACMGAGAAAFLQKSDDYTRFQHSISRLVEFWGHDQQLASSEDQPRA